MSVLVVDDDPDTRDLLTRAVAETGLSVRSVPNGREALAAIGTAMPRVVVLDMRMPEMDGVRFLGVIRSYLRWSTLPVILVTAYPESPDVAAALALGVKRVFVKDGMDLEELARCVSTLAGEGEGSPAPTA
jgi:CheY-like chemotaxis protein